MADPPRIILIDTTGEATSVLAGRLRMQGYLVTVSPTPVEGARLALSDPPAAVIADLWMPSISGVQLCRLLKAEAATENVPVILRGPDGPRDRFWAERAGASAYIVKGRMGDLARALTDAIARRPAGDAFFTTFSGGIHDIHERIAEHLDAALFESVLAADVRALGTCDSFERLFDLFSQFVARVTSYRWLAVSTQQPARIGLHANPGTRRTAEAEARAALGVTEDTLMVRVEDEDALDQPESSPPVVVPIVLGGIALGRLAVSLRQAPTALDRAFVQVIAREIAGPIRMATLVEESQRMAAIDALTGLKNRRAFVTAFEAMLATAHGRVSPLSLILLDVDHFKAINDGHGHAAGDAALAALGRLLSMHGRDGGLAARWGGEEFVVALPDVGLAESRIFAESLRRAIEEMEVTLESGGSLSFTASVGLVVLARGETLDSVMERADQAMYAAKTSGRNRMVVNGDTLVATKAA